MTGDVIAAYSIAVGGLYFLSVIFAVLITETHLEDAFWWPIQMVKALLKSLYRVLFTGWRI